MLVTCGAPECARSSVVTLTCSTYLEIVDLETLYCPATTVCEIPQAKTPKSRFFYVKFSFGILIKELNLCRVYLLYSK